MKIILLKDIPKVGHKYDIKNVADGHALNLLIPRGLALAATEQVIKKVEAMKANSSAEEKIQGELLLKSLETIHGLTITLKEKANEKGHLFAGITSERLAEEILKVARLNIDPQAIKLDKPLKEIGSHTVSVEAMGKRTEFTVNIEAI